MQGKARTYNAAMSLPPFLLPPASDAPFPPAELALREPDGLLAIGGDLSPVRLLNAYAGGIFPWFSEDQPLLWWSPDPRMVFRSDGVHLSSRFRRGLRSSTWRITADTAFAEVMQACAQAPRPGQDGTWIDAAMLAAYQRLHQLGWAHSVETWVQGEKGAELVGGLYGLAIGRMFYGESMFSLRTDASKIAAAHLAAFLERQRFGMIDCQMRTAHLASLGAREIPRAEFVGRLDELTARARPGRWPENGAVADWY